MVRGLWVKLCVCLLLLASSVAFAAAEERYEEQDESLQSRPEFDDGNAMDEDVHDDLLDTEDDSEVSAGSAGVLIESEDTGIHKGNKPTGRLPTSKGRQASQVGIKFKDADRHGKMLKEKQKTKVLGSEVRQYYDLRPHDKMKNGVLVVGARDPPPKKAKKTSSRRQLKKQAKKEKRLLKAAAANAAKDALEMFGDRAKNPVQAKVSAAASAGMAKEIERAKIMEKHSGRFEFDYKTALKFATAVSENVAQDENKKQAKRDGKVTSVSSADKIQQNLKKQPMTGAALKDAKKEEKLVKRELKEANPAEARAKKDQAALVRKEKEEIKNSERKEKANKEKKKCGFKCKYGRTKEGAKKALLAEEALLAKEKARLAEQERKAREMRNKAKKLTDRQSFLDIQRKAAELKAKKHAERLRLAKIKERDMLLKQRSWEFSLNGRIAFAFCKKCTNQPPKSDAFLGCMQDMRMSNGNKKMSCAAAEETKQKEKADREAKRRKAEAARKAREAAEKARIAREKARKAKEAARRARERAEWERKKLAEMKKKMEMEIQRRVAAELKRRIEAERQRLAEIERKRREAERKRREAIERAKREAAAKKHRERRRGAHERRRGGGPSRTCTSNGDPHTTNFNGNYFHIQVPAIYIFAMTDDGLFEVQGLQTGSTGAGRPSYMRSCKIKYSGHVYTNYMNRDGFYVNCHHTQITVRVPGAYINHMMGVCGGNYNGQTPRNFSVPDGRNADGTWKTKQFDVSYGQSRWELGGYGGRMTKLSQWGLKWRPTVEECMYPKNECRHYLRDIKEAKLGNVCTPWGCISLGHL